MTARGSPVASPVADPLAYLFAAGDTREGSIKRVASAVGDGATGIRVVHEYPRDSGPQVTAAAGQGSPAIP